ncbi:uncharacterized protein LOC143477171 [Brachyhypopomus gauderio]|uniref:uncharacterized protein LOC143477171 n=1 Tax=Brachyhypopomus gauderio TaxID=698409 RepID=UPI004041ADDA
MAAVEPGTEPVQVDTVETKAEEEPANAESAPAPTEETQPTTEPPQSTEQSADGKGKPASEKIWDSFLNKSGLGKVMGGKKKKDPSTVAEDAAGEEPDKSSATNQNEHEGAADPKDQPSSPSTEAGEAVIDGQATEKVPDNEEGIQDQKVPGVKPKHGEKSSVRDFIRKPVARIFSHRSTDKKDGELQKARSKSLDRLADAEVSAAIGDQIEDPQAEPEEPDKSTAQAKHMKRWHSFKKIMAQKAHKKSTDDSKDVDGADGANADGAGDIGTLDSTTKSEHTGQKRWKLKRSWTFQGVKRDPSIVGIHKPKDKDISDSLKDENDPEAEKEPAQESEESKGTCEGETLEKTNAEGEEEKGATAVARAKSVDHHANEIWTSFKKRVIPKSKKAADAGGGEEEPACEQEQTDEPQAGKDSGKTAKSKRTHFNRAVSLKNFILRKGKSPSMDLGESSAVPKEGEEEAKEIDAPTDTAGTTDLPQGGSEDQAATQSGSSNGAQVADEHKSSDGEETSLPSVPSGQQSDTPHLSSEGGGQTETTVVEAKTNGENKCSDAASEDTTEHNHEPPAQNDDSKEEETNKESVTSSEITCSKDGKILAQDGKCSTGNAVAQSE